MFTKLEIKDNRYTLEKNNELIILDYEGAFLFFDVFTDPETKPSLYYQIDLENPLHRIITKLKDEIPEDPNTKQFVYVFDALKSIALVFQHTLVEPLGEFIDNPLY